MQDQQIIFSRVGFAVALDSLSKNLQKLVRGVGITSTRARNCIPEISEKFIDLKTTTNTIIEDYLVTQFENVQAKYGGCKKLHY